MSTGAENHTDTGGSNGADGGTVTRRRVLKSGVTAIVGVVGVSGLSGVTAAGDGECPYSYPSAPSWLGEVRPEAGTFHEWPWAAENLTIFIHGFTNQNGGRSYAYEIHQYLSTHGYGGSVTTCNWDAGDSWDEWYSAKNHSIEAGAALAGLLDANGLTGDHGVTVNLVAHSLGGKLALECVRELQTTYGRSINSVNLFGAAVWDEQPGERFYDGILYGTNETHNYYSENDDTLGDIYQAAEFGRHACGYTGGAGGEPGNWYDHDLTARIDHHCQYMDSADGCVADITDDLG
ncbi:DUF726 domain-containing protein [Halocatena pleomorpha]|uniref:DUF726 domain-containing protein n=1 Tax=Halocatena pleomorpha TaxID=1785090 RepID=A0A3P3RJG0_9EURY|nr:DUF726 domain-containing protein [Halocatena pleomorpha]RRJ32960.1 DUF726 domain-containing protein [Halocatena pleomorpha]